MRARARGDSRPRGDANRCVFAGARRSQEAAHARIRYMFAAASAASSSSKPTWVTIPCKGCGATGECAHEPTGLEQSLDEMEFARSACSAAQAGDVERLRRCIERNAACVHHDGVGGGSGYTPLHYAARGGHGECVSLLLNAKASVLARTSGGATPLMRAAFTGHAAVVSQLLRAGAAADVQDADGDTALHKAGSQQHADAVGVLQRAMSPEAMELHNRKGVAAREVLERANAAAAAGPT
jgi:hypothetical protein